jgi:hypothetical protein
LNLPNQEYTDKQNKKRDPLSFWMSDCRTEEDKKRRVMELQAAAPILNRIEAMLRADLETLQCVNRTDYDCPSWASKQAHYNGEIAQIKKQLRLVSLPKTN